MSRTAEHDDLEARLEQALEHAGSRTPVGEAPVAAIRERARTRSRVRGLPARRMARRPWVSAVAVAAAIAVVIGGIGIAVDAGQTELHNDATPIAGELPPAPGGATWMGIGDVAFPVPQSWIDAAVPSCASPPPISGLWVYGRFAPTDACLPAPVDPTGSRAIVFGSPSAEDAGLRGSGREVAIDGVAAFSSGVESSMVQGDRLWHADVLLPQRDLLIEVTSARSGASVQRLIGQIRILDAASAVPAPAAGLADLAADYDGQIEEAGLRTRVVEVESAEPEGRVLATRPAVGTTLPLGSEVVIEVAADGSGTGALPAPPEGTRWMGSGPVAVPVPFDWETRYRIGCPYPVGTDSFSAFGLPELSFDCASPPGYDFSGKESVVIGPPPNDGDFAITTDRPATVDGKRALASGVRRRGSDGRVYWRGAVYLPAYDMHVDATSTESADVVRDLLAQVRILDGATAVPTPEFPIRVAEYARILEAAGFSVRERRVSAMSRPGSFVALDPVHGTMLPTGSEVVIEVSEGTDQKREALAPPTRRQMIGAWRLVDVGGEPPPADAKRRVEFTRENVRWNDGVNDSGGPWRLTRDGSFDVGPIVTTLVGCIGSSRCDRPAGIGIEEADGVRVTDQGDLLFLDGDREVARYAPVL